MQVCCCRLRQASPGVLEVSWGPGWTAVQCRDLRLPLVPEALQFSLERLVEHTEREACVWPCPVALEGRCAAGSRRLLSHVSDAGLFQSRFFPVNLLCCCRLPLEVSAGCRRPGPGTLVSLPSEAVPLQARGSGSPGGLMEVLQWLPEAQDSMHVPVGPRDCHPRAGVALPLCLTLACGGGGVQALHTQRRGQRGGALGAVRPPGRVRCSRALWCQRVAACSGVGSTS